MPDYQTQRTVSASTSTESSTPERTSTTSSASNSEMLQVLGLTASADPWHSDPSQVEAWLSEADAEEFAMCEASSEDQDLETCVASDQDIDVLDTCDVSMADPTLVDLMAAAHAWSDAQKQLASGWSAWCTLNYADFLAETAGSPALVVEGGVAIELGRKALVSLGADIAVEAAEHLAHGAIELAEEAALIDAATAGALIGGPVGMFAAFVLGFTAHECMWSLVGSFTAEDGKEALDATREMYKGVEKAPDLFPTASSFAAIDVLYSRALLRAQADAAVIAPLIAVLAADTARARTFQASGSGLYDALMDEWLLQNAATPDWPGKAANEAAFTDQVEQDVIFRTPDLFAHQTLAELGRAGLDTAAIELVIQAIAQQSSTPEDACARYDGMMCDFHSADQDALVAWLDENYAEPIGQYELSGEDQHDGDWATTLANHPWVITLHVGLAMDDWQSPYVRAWDWTIDVAGARYRMTTCP
jgi:hypothetical protein